MIISSMAEIRFSRDQKEEPCRTQAGREKNREEFEMEKILNDVKGMIEHVANMPVAEDSDILLAGLEALYQKLSAQQGAEPECKHVWLHNVKKGWKVCDKCGERR